MKGTVKFYNKEKGFGFVTDEQGQDHFLNKAQGDNLELESGDKVSFSIKNHPDGKTSVSFITVEEKNIQKTMEEVQCDLNESNEDSIQSHEHEEKTMPETETSDKENNRDGTYVSKEDIEDTIKRSNQKESKLKAFLKIIADKLKKIGETLTKPFVWVSDQFAILLMPKETRAQVYNEALNRARAEMKKDQEKALKEDARTLIKKNEILRAEKTDAEKVVALAKLSFNEKKQIIAPTNKGALMFERVGNSVLIKHANPVRRTAESEKMTYGFKTVGAIEFSRYGRITKQHDMDLVLNQVTMDNSFDKNTLSIPEDVILENANNYGTDRISDNPVEINDVDKQIAEGNRDDVRKEVLEAIDIPDQVVQDENITPDTAPIFPNPMGLFPNMYFDTSQIPAGAPGYGAPMINMPVPNFTSQEYKNMPDNMDVIGNDYTEDIEDVMNRNVPDETHTDRKCAQTPTYDEER